MIQNVRKRLFRKLISRFFIPHIQFSYSQFGEDVIIAHLLSQVGITRPSYLDIGANEPKFISNTFYFYERGASGVLVEPNPYLFEKLMKSRPRDIVLNTGIGMNETTEADFYVFPNRANGLNTFSKAEAMHWQETGMKGLGKVAVEKVIKMPLTTINAIMEKYFSQQSPNILSIDVEGLDLEILKSLDFQRYNPEVICVETLQYDSQQKGHKNNDIINLMSTQQYEVYADTRVNTIFCKKSIL